MGCCGPFLCFSNPKVWHTEEEDLSLPAADLDALRVKTYNGDIRIKAAHNTEEITVHIVKKAGGEDEMDAAACMKSLRIIYPVEGRTQYLEWKWEEKKKKTWGQSVSFEIHLPAALSIERAETYNGHLVLEDMASGAELETYNGDVRVERLKGKLDLETYNGDAQVTHSEGSVRIETYNGNITVSSTTPKMEVTTYNGEIVGNLAAVPTFDGYYKSYNGSIQLRFMGDPSVQVSCYTYNGSISVPRLNHVTLKKKRKLSGRIGDGKGTLEVETYNGNIRID
jgi:DUF4097 and DUF4098 domain-containing protein YvlB